MTPDPLARALDAAISGDPRALYDMLTRGSNLPGPRVNQALADAFAEHARARGAAADAAVEKMARLHADHAPGGTALEFIPVCGVLAVGARAAADDRAYPALLAILHDAADDLRFRVRDAVVHALAKIGERRGETLVEDAASWMDGFFHAAAVVRALGELPWMSRLTDATPVVARLDEAFVLARDATRAAFRYPGHKALVEALMETPKAAAARFGVPVFDLLERWSAVKEPILREVVEKAIAGGKLASRFAPDVARVKKALAATEPERRDPRSYVGPTRGRGKKRR